MDNSHTGRKVAVGVAIESERGTAAAAAQAWQPHLSANFYDRQEHQDNESAMGVDEKINDSEIQARWSDGTINGKIMAETFGFFLSGVFGVPTSEADGDATKHVFRYGNALTGLTVFRKSPVKDLAFSRATFSNLEVAANAKEFATFNAEATAMKGASVSSTPNYGEDTEAEFSGKHVEVRIGETDTAMDSSDRLSLKSINLNLPRDVEAYFGLGNEDPDEIDADSIEINGNFVMRYRDDSQEAAWKSGVKQWLSIKMINTAVEIGSGVTMRNPSLEFRMPKVSFREMQLSDDLNAKVDQTINFTAEFSRSELRAIEAILINSRATYAAA